MSSKQNDDHMRWNQIEIEGSTYTFERPPALLAKIDLEAIQSTPVYHKTEGKEQCGMCKMYYRKDSVKCRVPNHRIIDIRRALKYPVDGQRYNTASYLYASSCVCTFCAQMFSDLYDPHEKKQKASGDLANIDRVEKLHIQTQIKRANTAIDKRTYQSSIIDKMHSDLAITIPYNQWSKTRREVDPWWEVDFGQPENIDSLTFDFYNHNLADCSIYILLLQKPMGHENPFLDQLINQAVQSSEHRIAGTSTNNEETVKWTVPYGTTCQAIRVQLRGIHSLYIKGFCAYKGDNFVKVDKLETESIMKTSYATLSPIRQDSALKAMMSANHRSYGKSSEGGGIEQMGGVLEKAAAKTDKLQQLVYSRYEELNLWKEKVKDIASFFKEEELKAIFYVIFIPCVLEDQGNKKYDIGQPHKLPNSARDRVMITEDELMDDGLLKHNPRCELETLYHKLRSIVLLLQSQGLHVKNEHLKLLYENVALMNLVDDSQDALHELHSVFESCERFWKYSDAKSQKAHDKKVQKQITLSPSKRKTIRLQKVARGCSWSQFIMLISFVVQNRIEEIPKTIFNIEDDHIRKAENYHEMMSVSTDHSASMIFDSTFMSRGSSRERVQIVKDIKALSNPDNFLDTRFAEYKFGNFRKKFDTEFEFPKQLSADFNLKDEMKKQMAERAVVAAQPTSTGQHGKRFMKDDDGPFRRGSSSSSTGQAIASTPMVKAPIIDTSSSTSTSLVLPFICALCVKKYHCACTYKVMQKQIITLRRSWDPKLIPPEFEVLEQGTSMFNLMPVCDFCSQYFDPDVDGSIAYPDRDMKQKRKKPIVPKAKGLDVFVSPYFDIRYPIYIPAGSFFQENVLKEARMHSKNAMDVVELIKQHEKELEPLRLKIAKEEAAMENLKKIEEEMKSR